MQVSGQLSLPLGRIDDPLACAIHAAGAAWFAWRALELVRRAGAAQRRAGALAIFAGSAVGVLATSALYHGLPAAHAWKASLQRMDHAAIFLLIAGTLTALHAIGFRGRGRWWMVGLIWLFTGLALLGKIVWWARMSDGLGLVLYVGLSAAGLSSMLFLPRKLPWHAFVPMAGGALVYGVGALLDHEGVAWLVPGVLGPHEIFHGAVLGALLLHWRFFHAWAIPGRVAAPSPAAALAA